MMARVFRLEVPALPQAVRIVRAVASGAAAEAEMSYDKLDDLGLAIDEASAAILESGASDRLLCEAAPTSGGLKLAISATVPGPDAAAWPPAAGSLAEVVLRAVAADVEFVTADDRPTVTFVVA